MPFIRKLRACKAKINQLRAKRIRAKSIRACNMKVKNDVSTQTLHAYTSVWTPHSIAQQVTVNGQYGPDSPDYHLTVNGASQLNTLYINGIYEGDGATDVHLKVSGVTEFDGRVYIGSTSSSGSKSGSKSGCATGTKTPPS